MWRRTPRRPLPQRKSILEFDSKDSDTGRYSTFYWRERSRPNSRSPSTKPTESHAVTHNRARRSPYPEVKFRDSNTTHMYSTPPYLDHYTNLETDYSRDNTKTRPYESQQDTFLMNPTQIQTLILGGHSYTEKSYRVKVVLQSTTNGVPLSLKLWTRKFITTISSNPRSKNDLSRRHNEIDVLIGMAHYWDVVEINSNRLLPSGLVHSNTKLDPVLSRL
ncbi:hypothetical protein COOONC_23162 [Cooperia oncophora]